GTDALGVNRIGEHVETAELQQERDVVDEGERDPAAVQTLRQRGRGTIGNPLRPQCTLSRSLPAQEVVERSAGSGLRIEESLTIEVSEDGPGVARPAVE